jgi:hypothetical protein
MKPEENNVTSHSIYAHDALHVVNMNKGMGGQQPWSPSSEMDGIVMGEKLF